MRFQAVLWALVVVGSSPAALALSPEELLERIDVAEYGAKDSVISFRMELEDKDGKTSVREVKMYQKGFDKRLLKILAPADVKGISFLDAGNEKTYVYMPAFRKIRRVAGHVKNESFAGSDFSNEDLSTEKFSERVKVDKMTDDEKHYILEVTQKDDDGEEPKYAKMKMWIRKQDFLFDRLEYYTKTGEMEKTFIRKDFKKSGKYVYAQWGEMIDLKKQHKTRMITEKVEYDTGLRDRFFTKRQLKRH
jgi:hypothetical protein